MRVLIVEDDPELSHALRDGFRDLRIEATTAATFAEGQERALLASHDVIVLDVMLPGGSGFDLCAQLRERG
ncbi:MAG: response regulator transcription factor, partial [Gemmatimonadaceae bacterium]